jgi:hypothetical protein
MSDPELVAAYVLETWLQTGEALSAQQIAEGMGRSVASVRRVLQDNKGFVCANLTARQEHRQSFSRSYTDFATGSHKVWVYEPSREALRAAILAARSAP